MGAFLQEREQQIITKGKDTAELVGGKPSLAGSVSQRACVFCGSRVVLYPIADALHLIHGPVGCASYTWDIRGAMSSGPELHRNSFSTDLREKHVIFGGEKQLYRALHELIDKHQPKATFVYSTCIVGIIGDDVQSVCKRVEAEKGIPVIPVMAEGFQGTKKDGYKIACDAMANLIGTDNSKDVHPFSINILGDFNLAGELWILTDYYRRMGIRILASITGDGRVRDIQNAHRAALNVVQCSGSMMHLAKIMKEQYGVPFIKVSYFGIEDMSDALYEVARFFGDETVMEKARELVRDELSRLLPALEPYKKALRGKRAAIYVGGAFKAISLVKALRLIGVQTVIAGTQTGNTEDYKLLKAICDDGCILVDDSNPIELSEFVKQTGADLFIGGVKERPIAAKLGIGFCDHNHERKLPLAGYEGMLNFAEEVYNTVTSPVWRLKSQSPAPSPPPPLKGVEECAVSEGLQKSFDVSGSPPEGGGGWGASNACKQCTPLGACMAFKGIEGVLPMLHGSQGCATYIRRYMISHFREPVDIASSNFSEETTIFGGNRNFNTGIDNIIRQYHPAVIAIASTCLSETIGEDVQRLINEYKAVHGNEKDLPEMIYASTPSYSGTHYDGFHQAVHATVKVLASAGDRTGKHINLFNNFISPEDIRHLKEIMNDFGIDAMLFPDYSDTLDNPSWDTFQRIPQGGTSIAALKRSASAMLSAELGYILNAGGKNRESAGEYLQRAFDVPCRRTGLPVGIRETDKFFDLLSKIAGKPVPEKYRAQRGRLVDLYIDGHKYVSNKRAVIYGEEDWVVALAAFAAETGIRPVLCASGGESGKLRETLKNVLGDLCFPDIIVGQGMSFEQMETLMTELQPDLMIGNSKGYYIARKMNIPLVRTGFPVHDRIGAAHAKTLGYEGTTLLFEHTVNTLLEDRQRRSSVGYKYM
ncbi:MAG: nitrogenase iron-molybdenum cofactor biosynthesis protein NifE [Bacteroidales bacterium]|jgi:nitrogenase molybdenum-iron cofactor biosynthesis protein NifE|nr:nitrogenase iron-molybdenum cofactor biosynthesis protein NifE [Bacteroidales bacterium]